jgi:hypothetical protein
VLRHIWIADRRAVDRPEFAGPESRPARTPRRVNSAKQLELFEYGPRRT